MTTDIIEVGGVKIEVNMDGARKVEHFRVGDRVKILKKLYTDFKPFPGVIIGFDAFKERPTIIVCYLDVDYSKSEVKFAHINSDSEGVELIHMNSAELKLDKADMASKLDFEINKKRGELDELIGRKAYFLAKFNKYFGEEGSGE